MENNVRGSIDWFLVFYLSVAANPSQLKREKQFLFVFFLPLSRICCFSLNVYEQFLIIQDMHSLPEAYHLLGTSTSVLVNICHVIEI